MLYIVWSIWLVVSTNCRVECHCWIMAFWYQVCFYKGWLVLNTELWLSAYCNFLKSFLHVVANCWLLSSVCNAASACRERQMWRTAHTTCTLFQKIPTVRILTVTAQNDTLCSCLLLVLLMLWQWQCSDRVVHNRPPSTSIIVKSYGIRWRKASPGVCSHHGCCTAISQSFFLSVSVTLP